MASHVRGAPVLGNELPGKVRVGRGSLPATGLAGGDDHRALPPSARANGQRGVHADALGASASFPCLRPGGDRAQGDDGHVGWPEGGALRAIPQSRGRVHRRCRRPHPGVRCRGGQLERVARVRREQPEVPQYAGHELRGAQNSDGVQPRLARRAGRPAGPRGGPVAALAGSAPAAVRGEALPVYGARLWLRHPSGPGGEEAGRLVGGGARSCADPDGDRSALLLLLGAPRVRVPRGEARRARRGSVCARGGHWVDRQVRVVERHALPSDQRGGGRLRVGGDGLRRDLADDADPPFRGRSAGPWAALLSPARGLRLLGLLGLLLFAVAAFTPLANSLNIWMAGMAMLEPADAIVVLGRGGADTDGVLTNRSL